MGCMSSESKIRTPSDGIVGALAAHARGFMNSLLGIGRKARLRLSRMIYPDYDAIGDLLEENDAILGTDRFSLEAGVNSTAGSFLSVPAAEKAEAPVIKDDDSSLFERVDDGAVTSQVDYQEKPVFVHEASMATATSGGTVVNEPTQSNIGIADEPEQKTEAGASDAPEFFPGIEQKAAKAAEEPVISFPIEDRVVDMMILTVSGIDGDAVEFGDVEQENLAIEGQADIDDGCGMFVACDGTVIDMNAVAETDVQEEACMLSAPEQISAISAPMEMSALSAPAEAAQIGVSEQMQMIDAPEEVMAVGAPEQFSAIAAAEAPAAIAAPVSAEYEETQSALVAAGVEVFVQETVDRLVEEEAREQARLEAAIAEAAFTAEAVRKFVQETVDRIAAEEAEKQAKLEAALAQAALTAAAVRVFVQESVDTIAAEEAEKQARADAMAADAPFVVQAIQAMTLKTVSRIADEESRYIPEVRESVSDEAVSELEVDEPDVYSEAFVSAPSVGTESDSGAEVCTDAMNSVMAQVAETSCGRTSVSFGFFGMPQSPVSRASTVMFRFGRA